MVKASPLISIVLLVALAVVIGSATASQSHAGPPVSLDISEFKRPFLLPPPGKIIPKIEICWESIVKVEGCAADLRSSSLNSHVNITRDCCDAVVSLGAECFIAVFTNFPFNPLFPPLLKGFCNAIFSGTGRNSYKINPPPPPPAAA